MRGTDNALGNAVVVFLLQFNPCIFFVDIDICTRCSGTRNEQNIHLQKKVNNILKSLDEFRIVLESFS